jgi:hypothetical protein
MTSYGGQPGDPKRLSVVVPYRDREAHLRVFLPHLLAYFGHDKLDRTIPVGITVAEQEDGLPFNRGALLNAGFLLTEAFDYHCFHDVDYLPIWADYRYPETPARLVWFGAEERSLAPQSGLRVQHLRDSFFGAVVLFRREHFRRVNGFSNGYWGWGSEDSDLRLRCAAEGLEVEHRDGTFRPLDHRHAGYHPDGTPAESVARNEARYAENAAAMASGAHQRDGLSSARFTVLRRETLEPGDHRARLLSLERVLVQLPGPEPRARRAARRLRRLPALSSDVRAVASPVAQSDRATPSR